MKPGVNSNVPNTTRQTQPPKQEKKGISRKGQTSVGLGALAYSSGYVNGGDYSDGGMGISVGVRPLSFLEIEGSYGQYSDTGFSGDPNRLNRPLQAVGQIYFNPNQRISPYITGGYAWNHIDIQDSYQVASTQYTAKQDSVLTGKVLGGGVELNLSKHFGVELDGRYFMYDNLKATQPAKDTASLVSVGLIVYF
jgi:opacity protein-like surface antigen